jgi:hypothetical protein
VSITHAASPLRSASTGRWAASMVLPLPPFCDSMTIVFMKSSLSIKHGLLKDNTAGHWWASAVYNFVSAK